MSRRESRWRRDLRDFIVRVREQVCGGDGTELAKFKVYLVAHSMGGLICRTYLQNVARDKAHYVDKVFTYATPHGGIEMMGLDVPDLGVFDRVHVFNFHRHYMQEYLRLSKDAPVTSLDGGFSANRFFCFVGTNYKDYDAFFGMSRRGTGPTSDGLVMMKNAVVDGAPRAFAHRSHSGPFGVVDTALAFAYGLRTDVGSGNASKRVALSAPDGQGRMHLEIPLGFKEGLKNPPRPGFRGRLLLAASPWNR